MAIEATSGGPGGTPLRAAFDASSATKGAFEVAGRLAEDLKALSRECASTEGDADARSRSRHALGEDVQRQLRVAVQVLSDIADDAEADRPRAEVGGGSCGMARTGGSEDASELLQKLLALDLPARLVASLSELEFEVRKDVISVFSAILRLCTLLPGADQQIYEYARSRPDFFMALVDGYERAEIATKCGVMLRSCARHKKLVEAFFSFPEVVLRLLSFTRNENFDISSDAFSSLQDFLLTHKAVASGFLEDNFKAFFAQYNGLLQSEDYISQRQALKLLSEMLLHRTFMRVMLSYIGDEAYLQIHMNLLRDDSKAIQYESFHVFKIFVANPQKPPRVQQILFKNKDKLIKLLDTIRPKGQEDAQFLEDKATVIEKLRVMELPARIPSQSAGGGYNAS
eukprot:TRINITY_DN7814_c0_g1_i1.p1 TRINITY_DN7814_c0_g1~~TRINITY_DN7814_c0_g1_i1.p1  ORF type:complete len:399 (+),score=108.17 TRINITY_DN7814_c0_g1_i1:173-1369(+)